MISILRIIVGLVFLLFLPGYSLMGALFPRRDDLDNLERLGLGVGVSIALTASITALLNSSPWGIQLESTTISVGLFTLVASLIACYRLGKLQPESRFLNIGSLGHTQLSTRNLVVSALLLMVVLTVFGIGIYLGTISESRKAFTQFYITGGNETAADYPDEIEANQPFPLTIGITNHEYNDVQYRVVKVSDIHKEQIASPRLGHEERWKQFYTLILTEPGEHKVVFLLYRDGDTEPYRSLHLWITVKEPTSDPD